jgi:hypothetical protein
MQIPKRQQVRVSTLAFRSTTSVFQTRQDTRDRTTRHTVVLLQLAVLGGDDPVPNRPPRCRTQVLRVPKVIMQLLIRITDAAPGPYVMILHAA